MSQHFMKVFSLINLMVYLFTGTLFSKDYVYIVFCQSRLYQSRNSAFFSWLYI